MFQKTGQILRKVVECLKHEPEELQEGKICMQSRKNLEKLDVLMENIYNSMEGPPSLLDL